jgi:integrase
MPKLVEGFAARLRVPTGKRDVHVWDDALPGFGIRKFESGKKYCIVKFTVNGQQRKLSLGLAVPGVLAEMRKKASDILARAKIGQDIVEEKRAASKNRRTATVGELVPKYLQARASEPGNRTYTEWARYLERYRTPIHGLPIDAVQRRDVVRVIDDLAQEHGKVAADRARTALSRFFSWAIDRSYLDLNPVQNIARRAQGAGRTRVLSEAKLAIVWRACGDDDHGRIVRLLILTGQRKSEIGDLSWPEVDLEKRQLDLPPERTKNRKAHLVSLSDQVLAIFEGVSRREGRDLLFGIGAGGFSGWSKAKEFLDDRITAARAEAREKPLPGWTLHDLRRSVVTHLHERGFAQPHVVEAIVNHVSGHRGGVAGMYNKALYLIERRRAGAPAGAGASSSQVARPQ